MWKYNSMKILSKYTYNNDDCISLYYKYIIKLLHSINSDKYIKLIYNDNVFAVDNMYTCIYVNLEHTLVKQGGRGVLSDTEDSVIKYDNNNYNIRLCNTECYTNANIIFDYSIPNIINTKTSKYSVYYKSIYVPPIIISV